jgi:ribonuclease P protein component
MIQQRFTFKKEERLCSKIEIDNLFANGKSLFVYPFKVIYSYTDSDSRFPAKVLISVPKRNHKRAVARNLIKRLFRESYRLNKNLLYSKLNDSDKKLNIAFVYISKDKLDYKIIEKSVVDLLNRIINNL